MSRIGKNPVVFDNTVQVSVTPANEVVVKGAKTAMTVGLSQNVSAKIEDGKIVLTRKDDTKESRAQHGLYRALVQNAVTGVTKGFTKGLELNGVGYRANVAGQKLEMSLGFSHPVNFEIPAGIEIKVDKQTNLTITGADKALVGQVAAKLRSYRPPEPYLGKGIRYTGEVIRRKAGKSAGK